MTRVNRPTRLRREDIEAGDRPGTPAPVSSTPVGSTPVGSTLVCPTCGISGVVRVPPGFPSDSPACHGPMKVGRPVPCDEVPPRRPDNVMMGGRLYVDEASGFHFWCTRGGPGQVRLGERSLSLRSMAIAF
jgi:hypothetical protein